MKNDNLKFKIIFLAILFFGVFGLTKSSWAVAYYVDKDGLGEACSDNNSGNINRPWCTIQKAVNTMLAGDTVYVRQAIYYENINIDKDGMPDNYLNIKGFEGERPIIDGQYVRNNGFLLGSYTPANHGRSYIWIENFEIKNTLSDGLRAVWANGNGNSHIVLKNLLIHDAIWNGIYLGGSGRDWIVENLTVHDVGGHCLKFAEYDIADVIVANNTLYNCGYHSQNTDSSRHPYGIQVSYMNGFANANVDNFTIRNNKIHDSWQAGINFNIFRSNIVIENNEIYNSWTAVDTDLGTGMGAIQLANIATDDPFSFTIRNNKIHNSFWRGISLSHSISGGVYNVYNNLIYSNQKDGLYVGARDNTTANILNNIFYNNGVDTSYYEMQVSYSGSSNNTYKNNIFFHQQDGVAIYSNRKIFNEVWDNNIYWRPGANADTKTAWFFQIAYTTNWSKNEITVNTGQETNGWQIDPLLVNPAGNDFHLQSISPAINAGANVAVDSDIENISRPQGSGWDIGAYEYVGAAPADSSPPAPPSGLIIM